MNITNNNSAKYYDPQAVLQVIGCTLNDLSLLDSNGKYFYGEEDFCTDFHRVVFGAINNLYAMGATDIGCKEIEFYLDSRPESKAVYLGNDGNS